MLPGRLKNLKELNVSFNHLKSIPSELGDCENLERLDCSGNLDLMDLPFEVRNKCVCPMTCYYLTYDMECSVLGETFTKTLVFWFVCLLLVCS